MVEHVGKGSNYLSWRAWLFAHRALSCNDMLEGVQEMAIAVTKLNDMAKRNETSH